jgi:hypothetical protein
LVPRRGKEKNSPSGTKKKRRGFFPKGNKTLKKTKGKAKRRGTTVPLGPFSSLEEGRRETKLWKKNNVFFKK